MTKLTVTAKGQVTFRKDILQHLGVGPGERLAVDKLSDGRLEVRAAPTGKISDLFGSLKRPGQRRLSIDEMNRIIARGWAGKK
ncbi:MAG: AbrB/MazE/SpoVT family DNA-binding domain-containing protein [Rhodospirillaceae bacterium]|nr:AbrB/MazE/SpoVT family DNA-binding domain-containing protein [Rhodospirillaceae bacterium]